MRAQIRYLESKKYLKTLNPSIKPQNLSLPFYDNKYILDQENNKDIIYKKLIEFIGLPENTGDNINIYVVYYQTPWTLWPRLYLYTNNQYASKLAAIAGSELLVGKGGNGKEYYLVEF